MWQSYVGYTPIYDSLFSLGEPILRDRYEFQVVETTETSGNITDYYVVWIWKGDYWNLGAGAEIGIYHTDSEIYHNNDFYDIVVCFNKFQNSLRNNVFSLPQGL